MKKILLLIGLTLGFHTAATAQKPRVGTRKALPAKPEPPEKKALIPEPPRVPAFQSNTTPMSDEGPFNPVYSLPQTATETHAAACERLLTNRKTWPLSFVYKVDADTLILPGQVFQKELRISAAGVQLLTSFAADRMLLVSSRRRITSTDYNYEEGADTLVQISGAELAQLQKEQRKNLPVPPRVESAFFRVKMVKDTAVFTNIKTGEVWKYQLYTDLQKTKITEIWDLSAKRMYKPDSL